MSTTEPISTEPVTSSALAHPGVSATAYVARPRTNGSPVANFAKNTLLLTLSRTAYLVFVIVMPLVMYLLFDQIYGKQIDTTGVQVGAWIMINMACYGALGAAMNSGASIQLERRSGWFRQLVVAGLSGRGFIVGKLLTAVVLMIPTIALIFAAGMLTGVRLSVTQWLLCGLLIWVSMWPMVLFGLNIALWISGDAAQPATTIIMMALSVLGGLWFPADAFPHALRLVAYAMPTYWIGRLSTSPFDHTHFPAAGLLVLLGWTVLLALLALQGYRRATSNSKR